MSTALDHRPNEMPSLSSTIAGSSGKGDVEDAGTTDDLQILQFLAQSGLDAASIDPSSLEALKVILGSNVHSEDRSNESVVTQDANDSHHNGAGSHGSIALEPQRDRIAADELVNANVVEQRILHQLEQQLGLLMDLQRKLDSLTERVQDLQDAVEGPNDRYFEAAPIIRNRLMQRSRMAPRPTVQQRYAPPAQQRLPPIVAQPEQPPHGRAVRFHPDVVVNPQQPAAPARRHAAVWWNPRNLIMSMVTMLYESRISKIVRLFWRMQHQQVENFDAGLLFKLIVIVAAVTARWSSSNKRNTGKTSSSNSSKNSTPSLSQFWDAYRLYILLMMASIVFLVHSRYLTFLYNFFIKENYPVRIWCGEDVDMDEQGQQERPPGPRQPLPNRHQPQAQQVPPEQQQQLQPQPPGGRNQVENNDANRFLDWNRIWGNGLLRIMAGLPAPPPQELANDSFLIQLARIVVKTLIDIVCLIGSFVLSIFPMVNLEELRLPPPPENNQPAEGHPPAHLAAAAGREDRNEPAPGRVQPPIDPAEPLEE